MASAAAIAGDNVGFWIGDKGGYRLAKRHGKKVRLDERKLKVGRYVFDRHGTKVVFFGRFVSILRSYAAFLAGTSRMRWRRFLPANAAGGIVWAAIYTFAFYQAGTTPCTWYGHRHRLSMSEVDVDVVRDFQRGAVRLHVLHHAAEGHVSGVWLSDELGRHGYRISPGTLYPLLHDLEDAGLLVSHEQVVRGRVLRYYAVTDEGRRTLADARAALVELARELLPAAQRSKLSAGCSER